MSDLRKIEVSTGVFWIEAPSVGSRILCGCPADSVKHLMKGGLIGPRGEGGVLFETGPNAILLSDVMVQNGAFSNLAEFPVLQMLYRQGMLLPGHPGNTGAKPLLLGSRAEVTAQMQYIHRGNYGLISEEELLEAGVPSAEAHDMMRLKRRFAFGAVRDPSELLDTAIIESGWTTVRGALEVRRVRLNVFEFALGDAREEVDLNLKPFETYQSPYSLDYFYIPREYFAVLHSGEGDGWDINRPSMGSVLMFQGRIYLIDAGPNILNTLTALGIGVNEIEGIFHTHSHDDHFAGLTTLIRSDHRIKYYATPMVCAAVSRKMAALAGIHPQAFADYFDVKYLIQDQWNDVDGLEVRPIFSPHPVETTIFLFRAMWAGGYRTYAHYADICRLDVLRGFITEDANAPGLSPALFQKVAEDYRIPADIKKLDIGGGLIHGDAADFQGDASAKIILAHTALALTDEQKKVGQGAAFGEVDVLIPSDGDFIGRSALEVLGSTFPDVPPHQIRVLLNNPMVTFAPGAVLLEERHVPGAVWILLSGGVEALSSDGGVRSVLSVGSVVGELAALFDTPSTESFRAQGYVKALEVSRSLFGEFVARNHLLKDISRLQERREFLQRTWLLGEVVSTKTLTAIAREIRQEILAHGQVVDIPVDSMAVVLRGRIGRFIGERRIDTVGPGDFFGEEMAVFWTPSMFRLKTLETTEIMVVPADVVAGVPSIRWRLFEAWGKRMSGFVEGEAKGAAADLVSGWRDEYRVNVLAIDTQHRRLFELMTAATEVVEDADALLAALDALTEYTRYHFGDEEALFTRAGYTHATAHRRSHARLIKELDRLRADFSEGRRCGRADLSEFLGQWMKRHFIEEDRSLGQYLNTKGIY